MHPFDGCFLDPLIILIMFLPGGSFLYLWLRSKFGHKHSSACCHEKNIDGENEKE